MSDRLPAKIFSGSLSRPATRRVALIEGDAIQLWITRSFIAYEAIFAAPRYYLALDSMILTRGWAQQHNHPIHHLRNAYS